MSGEWSGEPTGLFPAVGCIFPRKYTPFLQSFFAVTSWSLLSDSTQESVPLIHKSSKCHQEAICWVHLHKFDMDGRCGGAGNMTPYPFLFASCLWSRRTLLYRSKEVYHNRPERGAGAHSVVQQRPHFLLKALPFFQSALCAPAMHKLCLAKASFYLHFFLWPVESCHCPFMTYISCGLLSSTAWLVGGCCSVASVRLCCTSWYLDSGSLTSGRWACAYSWEYLPPSEGLWLGCFRKCHFGIPRNTEFYTELVLFRVIPRNFLLFNSAEFRGILCGFVSTEFRIPSNENTIIEPITKDLWKLLMYFVVKGTVARDLPHFHQKYPPRSMIHILSWFHI